MSVFRFVFVVLITELITISTAYRYEKNNDWIPLIKTNVLRETKDFLQPSDYDWSPSSDFYNLHSVKENAIKVVEPYHPEKMKISNKMDVDNSEEMLESLSTDKNIEVKINNSTDNDQRKGLDNIEKQIMSRQTRKLSLHGNDESTITANGDLTNETAIVRRSYEVEDRSNDNIDGGYVYEKPTNSLDIESDNNDFKNKFKEILAKYNIKENDKLNNYDISKQTRKAKKSNRLIFVPLLVPDRYNSDNHKSVNPLIAVLLSNYGYYAPGYYGKNGSYRNLYGYLASNNIHNNLPFGSYKVFSDTDSSH